MTGELTNVGPEGWLVVVVPVPVVVVPVPVVVVPVPVVVVPAPDVGADFGSPLER
jgi:hypothetical protein